MTSAYDPVSTDSADTWWVQRWNDLLNTYRFKKRLERGRRYAREGHILSLKFKGAKVVAIVQGTAVEPYELSIAIERFTDEDWDFVVTSMAESAIYSAQLLAGTMPDDIEEVFTRNGLSLFPFKLGDVRSKCNCPDPKNPCKHVAAVYYQLGDFFREDPFVLFQLRGRTRGDILAALRQKRRQLSASEHLSALDQTVADRPMLPPDLPNFWRYHEPLDSSLVVITPSTGPTPLAVLGLPPLPPADARVVWQYLEQVYQATGQYAMLTALNRGM